MIEHTSSSRILWLAYIVLVVCVKGDLTKTNPPHPKKTNPSHSTITNAIFAKPEPAGVSSNLCFDSGINFSGAITLHIVHGFYSYSYPSAIKRVYIEFKEKSFGQEKEAVYNGRSAYTLSSDMTSSVQLARGQIQKIIVWSDDKHATAIQIQSVSGATSQMFGAPTVGSKPTEFQGGCSSLLVGFYGTFGDAINSLGFTFMHTDVSYC